MKKTLLLLSAVLLSVIADAQLKFTMVNPVTKDLSIKNYGSSAVDISTYRLCALFEYKTLNQTGITILSGDFMLSQNEEVTLNWASTTGFNSTSSDMGLYMPTGAFSSPSNMVAFMEYGSGNQGRESVAVSAGYWATNTFITGTGPFYYIGNGVQSGVEYWSNSLPVVLPDVVINEVDADQTGTDAAEFIELYGPANAALDGMVLVFFQGGDANNPSYAALDLSGFSTDADGFFVAGNTGVPEASLIFPGNTLQNGADGIGLYAGSAANWPNGTTPVADNLIDALVYGTADPDDTDLIAILTPGQPQVNESAMGNSTANSMSRVPDGGAAFQTGLYAIQLPTPGATNLIVIECSGATITGSNGELSFDLCSDQLPLLTSFINTSTVISASYIYVVADANDNILSIETSAEIDFTGYSDGTYYVWGLSYTGVIDAQTTSPGLPISGMATDACASLSSSFVLVTISNCAPPTCDGGDVSSADGYTYFTFCSDGSSDPVIFDHNSSIPEANYTYVITDNSEIIMVFGESSVDFDSFTPGTYHVWGLSYTGTLDPSTTEAGDNATNIVTDGNCLDLSSNFITVIIQSCAVTEGCTELYFSEYLEGNTGFNKALELYNPTNADIDLSEYEIMGYNNGSIDFTSVLVPQGILVPGATFVISNNSADAGLQALADTLASVALFNGNDALELRHNTIMIDVIGIVGENPGTNGWTVANGSTANFDLVRKQNISGPTSNWLLSTGQWDVYAENDWSNLGLHSALSCSDVPQLGFTATVVTSQENGGSVQVSVQAFNIPSSIQVNVEVTSGDAIADLDYTNVFPVTLDFVAGSSIQSFSIPIIDDIEMEYDEFMTLTLNSISEVNWTQQTINVIIIHNDQAYPLYNIAEVKTATNTLMDSIGVFCELQGVVHGINFNSSGLHFHIIDPTDGIKVFAATQNFGYSVQEGDLVSVKGQIFQFMGQAEIRPDSMHIIDVNQALTPPVIVTQLAEENESHLVKVSCVTLVNPSEWTNGGSGFTVNVSNGNTTFPLRIENESDIFGGLAPQGHFTITGIVEQFDAVEPLDSGYSIWLRSINDFEAFVIASFQDPGNIQFGDNGNLVIFIDSSVGALNYEWNFGDGNTSSDSDPSHLFDYGFLVANPSFDIALTVTNSLGCSDQSSITVDATYVGISENSMAQLSVFPNPFTSFIQINSASPIINITCLDANGKIISILKKVNRLQVSMDASDFANGIYFIKVDTETAVETLRVVKR